MCLLLEQLWYIWKETLIFLARLASSLLEPHLCISLTDDNDNDNQKKAQKFEKGKKGK